LAIKKAPRNPQSHKGKPRSEESRAAVMAALLEGQRVVEVAGRFNLPHKTVSNWKKQIDQDKLAEVGQKKAERFTDLIGDYLEQTLITLRTQAELFRDATWLRNQSAAELAVLHGVQADKAFRLLEAIERANNIESSGSE
jgi:transposase-like protein